jgi:hypothetical protein
LVLREPSTTHSLLVARAAASSSASSCIPWDIYSAWLDYDTEKQAAHYDNMEDDVGNNDNESFESEEEESVNIPLFPPAYCF